MSLTIEDALNGLILRENNHFPVVFDIDTNGLEAVQALLIYILDSIGHYGSKHDAERIKVTIEKNKDV